MNESSAHPNGRKKKLNLLNRRKEAGPIDSSPCATTASPETNPLQNRNPPRHHRSSSNSSSPQTPPRAHSKPRDDTSPKGSRTHATDPQPDA